MVYLIDASVYIYRAFYSALPERVDRDGYPVQAIWGFAKFLGDLLERVRPEWIAVAFDERPCVSFRTQLYAPYKAHREPTPAALVPQLERCVEVCRLLGVTALSSREYEADDVIGSVALHMRQRGVRAALVTRDKDLAQLMREGDVYWDYASAPPLGYHDVARRFGVLPERFADYLALTGDAVDNIPGVPGVGPKTAAALMREFDSLESLFAGLDQLATLKLRGTGALIERLRAHQQSAYLARRLTRIACDMPLPIECQQLRRRSPDLAGLGRFFDHHEFGPLLRQQARRLALS
ncbi:MAG TPA: 5'-3' exonuclease H3TH domain-containing protein [Steroidobacteraceae bacterium]|nr:5'-3' exonuclease H3TH domain-containing protein [Steroidobacteraceae bacterium]